VTLTSRGTVPKMRRVSSATYVRGLHDLGGGAYAFLQPDGSWGLSNAGLVVDGDDSLLVDTLFDLALTREMLGAMRAAEPRAAARIGAVVNTHHNGDHCFGNELVEGAEIIASAAAAAAMAQEPPALLGGYMKMAPALGPLGEYLIHCFGRFAFDGIRQALPTVTFSGRLDRAVGGKRVELHEVGPAHTAGDVIVHVPACRVVFTGDILFVDAHPVIWAGPVGSWIEACRRILAMDVDVVVPGHGPVTDKSGVREMAAYLEHVRDEATKRRDAGLGALDAAVEIAQDGLGDRREAERLAVNVAAVYRELDGDRSPPDVAAMFGMMAEMRRRI